MQITSFIPCITTSHAAEIVALLEELGFERVHTKTGINGDITSNTLQSARSSAWVSSRPTS